MKIATNLSDMVYKQGTVMYAFRELKTTSKGATGKYWGKKQYAPLKDIMSYYGISPTGEASYEKGLKGAFKSTKSKTLLANIQQVFDAKIDQSNYPEIAEKMMEKLEDMTDLELAEFAEKHKAVINLYFTYEEGDTAEEIDARFLIMAKELGINIEKENKNTLRKDKKTQHQMHIDYEWVALQRTNEGFRKLGNL